MRFIDNLIITQSGIRDRDEVRRMMQFVANGGFFTQDALRNFGDGTHGLIKVSRFEDEQEYIHDGHHRTLAIYLAGRQYLSDEEYTIKTYKYDDYLRCVPQRQFVTPFDPRKHCRLANFDTFASEALRILKENPTELHRFVNLNVHRYRTARNGHHIHHLAQQLLTH